MGDLYDTPHDKRQRRLEKLIEQMAFRCGAMQNVLPFIALNHSNQRLDYVAVNLRHADEWLQDLATTFRELEDELAPIIEAQEEGA